VTRILIAMSDFVRASGVFLARPGSSSLSSLECSCWRRGRRRPLARWLLPPPDRGGSSAASTPAAFPTRGILTASGVRATSLQSASRGRSPICRLRAAVDERCGASREGGALAPALGAAKLFPPLVIHLIARAEATGRLDTMLARRAEAQSRELENWIRGLTRSSNRC